MTPAWYARPMWHFVLMGGLIYLAMAALDEAPHYEAAHPGEARIRQLHDDWLRHTGRAPSQAELAAMVRDEIDRAVLVAEALNRGLHHRDPVIYQRLARNARFLGIEESERRSVRMALELGVHEGDEVIRRRLLQRMRELGRDELDEAPTERALRERYEAQRERWRIPARLRIEHVYFSARRGPGDAREAAERVLGQLREAAPEPATPAGLGDAFLHGHALPLLERRALERHFGPRFAEALFERIDTACDGEWLGPLRSSYGYHLVRVLEHVAAEQRSFDEVRATLHEEWREQARKRALRGFVARLRERYEVAQR